MNAVPVIVAGQEPEWLREQFLHLVGEHALDVPFAFEGRCPPGAGACVVLTDDLRRAGLRRLLFGCYDRMRGDRLVVLAWDDPRQAAELLRIPLVRLYFPAEDRGATTLDALRSFSSGERAPRVPYDLDPALPASLAVALRIALNRSGDPLGPPPPPTITALAHLVGCSRETLSRSARSRGLDLVALLRIACLRWIHLHADSEGRMTPDEAVGLGSPRTVRRWAREPLGTPDIGSRTISIERIDAVLLAELDPLSAHRCDSA